MAVPDLSPLPARLRVVHPVVHLRDKPSNNGERVSQALLGHEVTALREMDGWAWVETDDAYRGWADVRWLRAVDTQVPLALVTSLFADVRAEPLASAPLITRVSQGSRMQIVAENIGSRLVTVQVPADASFEGAQGFVPADAFAPLPRFAAADVPQAAVNYAREFRGTPYLWGGSSSWGLDCSGLAQFCYRLAGVLLRRDADIQRDDPRFVPVDTSDTASLLPGDLVFFGRPDRITHVGLHLEGNTFIHAAGGAGVIVTEWGDDRYSPGFVDARRLDPARADEPVTRFESETR